MIPHAHAQAFNTQVLVMTKFSPGNKWAAKLSNEDVFTIRSRYAAGGVTQMQLALDYHVSLNTIRYAIKGVTHQNVGMVETEDEVFSKAQESERVFRMMLETEELSPEPEPPPTPDPFAKMLSRAEPLEVSMARIRDAEAREHAERMSKLNELKTPPGGPEPQVPISQQKSQLT